MPRMRHLYGIGLVVLMAALPLKTAGCGNTACITVTADQTAQAVCPLRGEAQQRISGQGCDDPSNLIVTVTGDGDLDGTVCCYPVNVKSNEGPLPCIAPEGNGGGFSEGDGSTAASGGEVCPGGCCPGDCGPGCATCADVLMNTAPPATLCAGASKTAFADIMDCACNGPCAGPCAAVFCAANGVSSTCLSCLMDAATSGCSSPLTTCQQN
jgi:hypothetical protein